MMNRMDNARCYDAGRERVGAVLAKLAHKVFVHSLDELFADGWQMGS